MEIIPDTEAYRVTAEAAANNFEVLGADVRRPERVVYGFTPRGSGSYHSSVNTIFIGPETVAGSDEGELATYEHENIHYEQFMRLLGEPEENLQGLANVAENEALSVALEHFDSPELVNSVTNEQHLNYYNFRSMMGLISGHKEFLEEAYRTGEKSSDRIEFLDGSIDEFEETPEELHYEAAAESVEDIAEKYWDEILESEEVQRFRPLIERHDIDIPDDDVLEAQAQFWSMFTVGMLEDLPEASGEYPEFVEKKLEDLDSYKHTPSYSNGENVEAATRDILEEFRDRKHDESRPDPEIAVEMLNEGLERWERKGKTKARVEA